jgi:DNA-binding PadR family transcriptional regulator
MKRKIKKEYSLRKKILLYLLNYNSLRYKPELPLDLTQEGMANCFKTKQPRIAEALSRLREENGIEERTSYIENIKNRRRVYFLSNDGLNTAKEISNNLIKNGINIDEIIKCLPEIEKKETNSNHIVEDLSDDLSIFPLEGITNEKKKYEEKLENDENNIEAMKKLMLINGELENFDDGIIYENLLLRKFKNT